MERDPRLDALIETRERIAAMEALLEELPAIFEARFRQRLQPLLEQQQRLLSENADLRQQLLLLQGSETVSRRPRLLAFRPGDADPPTAASAGPTHK